MTDIPSVLLIVGTVVVGPIEAQDRTYDGYLFEYDKVVAACAHGGQNPIDKCRSELVPFIAVIKRLQKEDIDQLCERAMKEIGAVKLKLWQTRGALTEAYMGWALTAAEDTTVIHRSMEVRCIPTPTGYRK